MVCIRGVYPPNSHDATLPPWTPSSPLPYFFFPSPPFSFYGGPRVRPPENFLELQMLLGEFLSILDIKINTFMNRVFWLQVVSFEFQVNVHAALWIDEVLYVIIWQKYTVSVGLSQHDSAISSLITADWSLHYIICISSNFFLPPPEISMKQRASFPP